MTAGTSVAVALGLTTVLAVAARLAGALTTGGALAGFVVGVCVSAGFGPAGLAVLGTFFVTGSLATRIGWERKKERGTAEAGEGRRDWRRVLGKGGFAAAAGASAVLASASVMPGAWHAAFPFCAIVAAALADTLGTEIGTLSDSPPRSLPGCQRVPTGTPGAVSAAGLAGAAAGAVLVAGVSFVASRWTFSAGEDYPIDSWYLGYPLTPLGAAAIAAIGVAASLAESLAVGLGLRASGFARNLLTTGSAAVLGWLLWPLRGHLFE
jgi:uncharacterized protein (TIGR00297 family)